MVCKLCLFLKNLNVLHFYLGHVEMVFFLLERGADQEHKTDEMHTALMEASMVCQMLYNITLDLIDD